MPVCKKVHRHHPALTTLPLDQSGLGRHKCAGCAYELGYALGLSRQNLFQVDFQRLDDSQAGTGRHKSPHAAFALGYGQGIGAAYA